MRLLETIRFFDHARYDVVCVPASGATITRNTEAHAPNTQGKGAISRTTSPSALDPICVASLGDNKARPS